ncbi:MAG: glycosyltransferase family 4 protein [Candidatus Pacearchaeota archaeon]
MAIKVLHLVNENALGGGIGTVLNYLQEGLNSNGEFNSRILKVKVGRRRVGIGDEGPIYESELEKILLDGKEVEKNNLDKILSNYDIIHVHGIPPEGVTEKLEELKKEKGDKIKLINTAHSSVKQEFLAQYDYINKKAREKGVENLNKEEIYDYRALNFLFKNNILNNPARFNKTFWGSAIHRQERIMTLADIVQHMNESYKNDILEEYLAHENAHKHIVIPNGIKLDNYEKEIPPRPKKKRILFVGRFSKEKGIDELIESIPYILEKHPDAYIRIVGGTKNENLMNEYLNKAASAIILKTFLDYSLLTKEEADKLVKKCSYEESLKILAEVFKKRIKNLPFSKAEDLAKKLDSIFSRVHFVGWVSDKKEMRNHYLWSDYVIIPSYAESFCLTAAEALLYKRIPIVTATPSLRELYIDKGIALPIPVEKRNPHGLAEIVDEILKKDNSPEFDLLVEKGHEYVKNNYSFDNMIKKQIETYKKIIGKNSK